jgi:hypothetical protein
MIKDHPHLVTSHLQHLELSLSRAYSDAKYRSWNGMVRFMDEISGAKYALANLKSFFLRGIERFIQQIDHTEYEALRKDNYKHALELLKRLALCCNPDKITKIGGCVAIPIPADRLSAELNLFPNLTNLDFFHNTMGRTFGCPVSTRDMDQYVRELSQRCPKLAEVTSDWGPSVVYSIVRDTGSPVLTRDLYEDRSEIDYFHGDVGFNRMSSGKAGNYE